MILGIGCYLVLEQFSYELEIITRKLNQNNKRTGRKQFCGLLKGGKRARFLVGLANTQSKADKLRAYKNCVFREVIHLYYYFWNFHLSF